MTVMSFTLCGVDVTNLQPKAAVWWTCAECDAYVELPDAGTSGFVVPCPDCAEPLHEVWRWERAAA